MKKYTTQFNILVLCLLLSFPLLAQIKDQEVDTKEFVEVLNIEMTVRAMRKGKPVSGLKQSDFLLTENGEKLDINGFFEVQRKIGQREDVALEEGKDILAERKKRFFLFYFWIQEHKVKYRESLEYFFKNIYHQGDIVIFAIKNQAISITKPEHIEPSLNKLDKIIKVISDQWAVWITHAAERQQRTLDDYLEEKRKKRPNFNRLQLLLQIIAAERKSAWKEYQYKYLTSNTTKLMAMAKSLKKIPFEKWGMVIYQHTPFPIFDEQKLKMENAGSVAEQMRKVRVNMKIPPFGKQQVKPLQQAFISANATFHLLMPGVGTVLDNRTQHMVLEDVYSGWEDTFRQISEATGGDIVIGNILKTSIQKVSDREDVYYRLTYRPKNQDEKKRKIRIRTRDRKIKVFHVSKIKVDKPKKIEMSDLFIKDSKLSITLKNYLLVPAVDQELADIQLVITVTNEEGDVMEYMKKLELKSEEVTVTMKLNLPETGHHTLLVTAWDNYSGLKSQETISVGK